MATLTPSLDGQRYIPVGCLVYPLADLEKALRPYKVLEQNQWMRFESIVSIDDEGIGITRVFVLPDDAYNCSIIRSEPTLRRRKKDLLASLDFSKAIWKGLSKHGDVVTFPPLSPRAQAAIDQLTNDEDDQSLLKMFNFIPSPEPDLNLIEDDLPREFMSDLLASAIDGLTTEMYPYQCRSAALMHQREVSPGRILDPRLVEAVDQDGSVWYYNPVTRDTLQEPHYYDGIHGGILAEEMGSGKTLICLALIAATRHQPASVPELYQGSNITIRHKTGSLMDMAAAVATKHACPWKRYVDTRNKSIVRAIQRNPGWYSLPRPKSRRYSRRPKAEHLTPTKIVLSHASLVVVPANLLKQWIQEISKHTQGLEVLVLNKRLDHLPDVEGLLQCDIILCTVQYLQNLWQDCRRPEADGSWNLGCPLGRIRFKRCIVDEGHKLGNVRLGSVKTILLQVLDSLQISARWIVTGTPSKGLFGMEEGSDNNETLAESTGTHESKDIERIGAIATLYLKARPWSNTSLDPGDTPADWKVYVMQPKHSRHSSGRKDCLISTFNSLMIRHRLSEISHMLPAVDTKVVKLDGSYQDKLCLNIFSMMIISNAVQSQRTDQDYFFHQKSRKSLLELVQNLQQASFFGGSFYSPEEIQTAVQTAEEYLEKQILPIDEAEGELLRKAIELGKLAAQNKIKRAANSFHEMPIYIKHFPGDFGVAWSIVKEGDANLICTNCKMMVEAQRVLRPFLDSPEDLNTYLNSGSFLATGHLEHMKERRDAQPDKASKVDTTLAGNTKLGEDHVSPRKRHSASIKAADEDLPTPPKTPDESTEIAAPLADTQLVSTTSAKLSYLIDAIVTHQKEEQIIVFYENDNVAWYLGGVLEMLSIHHLIYAKGISVDRRAQYISTFNRSAKFRVLLMDISQAAFGLDMRSASRVYFINPVLNPQVEAQAIGRVRRISQQKRVTVEFLVLRDSIEEMIMERKQNMTQAEHRSCKTILDDGPIYEWILNAQIIPMPDVGIDDGPRQMAKLAIPQYIFGREFGRERGHPDEDIFLEDPPGAADEKGKMPAVDVEEGGDGEDREASGTKVWRGPKKARPTKRARFADEACIDSAESGEASSVSTPVSSAETRRSRPAKRARFDDDAGEASSSASMPGPAT